MDLFKNADGLANLQELADHVVWDGLPEDKSVPIVMVPGFSGWGSPIFGAINYWGGIENVPKVLMDRGYTLIISPIAPISTNWERACELYRQLTFGGFSVFNPKTNVIEDIYDVDVDYGIYFDSDPSRGPMKTVTSCRRRAILFSNNPQFYKNWVWSEKNKAHFICHSQGGNTIRYLISLMCRGAPDLHPKYFSTPGRDTWTISVTTLGTPHRGTTVIDVLNSFIPEFKEANGLLSRSFATISFQDPQHRAYDLQLDHWGICRIGDESFQEMRERFEKPGGPVETWLLSNNNAFYDNSIIGIHKLHEKCDLTSKHVYYFSLSFRAVVPFPSEWPPWTLEAIRVFPTPLLTFVSKVINAVPFLNTGAWVLGKLLGGLANKIEWTILSSTVSFPNLVRWGTEVVANRLLSEMGYNIKLPPPGKYMPRVDIIPFMLPTAYAMGGHALSKEQEEMLGPNRGDWFLNDGIVNTESMKGPDDSVVRAIVDFPVEEIKRAAVRGKYWHFGTNDKMDHADEIGVFVDVGTSHGTRDMYLNLATLVSRLPFH